MNNEDGVIYLPDTEKHNVLIEVRDAARNLSRIQFTVQYDPSLAKQYSAPVEERLLPNHLNIFERGDFELFTTEQTIYDTVNIAFGLSANTAAGSVSDLFRFLDASIPVHDGVTVRIRPSEEITTEDRERIVIKSISGTRTTIAKAKWQNGWVSASFRQFGSYQAFIDNEPPTVNAPATNLSKSSRIVFTPRDNFNVIKRFRVELDGKWLRFTNDKGRTWIYNFDANFPRGVHDLKVIVEDEAGNVLERTWRVTR